ncbi:PKD domain-containing protein [Thermoanaerobacterium sp. CMT5567-10]|uniref:PKD domain-containing protein n=1 Tax=Thermoanaerobacterium sp. CMT5567-10 TaxID=3061989 RepID=UPI0026E0895B|nr:PKD domain-containing protein [Thermoanaerobacterium sp. CMT5567-10]WKV09421.1 PKD domain-containing protein [Thermoanaerobacterium sp. CMT5567-10]
MSKRFKRILSIITLITFLVGLIYIPKPQNAYAAVIDDSGDLNLSVDSQVTINDRSPVPNPIKPMPNEKKLYSGKWNVMVDGTLSGYDKVVRHIYAGGSAEQYNFIKYSTIPQWITAFGGNPSFVNTYLSQIKLNISGSDRVYIRYITELCGAHVTGYKVLDEKGGKGEVYVATTRPPSANISISPTNPKENDNVKIMVSGISFFNFWNSDLKSTLGLQDKVVYTVDIDGQRVISAKTLLNQQNFTDTITKTFSAGQHTVTLYTQDAVGRITRKDYTFSVTAATKPPLPPGNIQAGINLTLDPSSLKAGTSGNVNATIDASSSVSSGTGPFGVRFWLQVNGVDLLGSDGTVLQDLTSLSKAKYTKLIVNAKPGDKVWAKVRVYDQSINKSSEAETTKIIGQYEDVPTPEPTPPPAPTPVPPVAGINAPSEVIQGDDVRISSSSYDTDGVITNYNWTFNPSIGIEGSISGDSGTLSFSNVGTYTIKLTVTDNDGLKDTAEKTIEVKPAVPEAFFDYAGALKENRKVVLDASGSYTSPKYPMVWDATEWDITSVSSGLTQDDIKIVSSTDMKTRTVLFKKAGDYKVRVKVKNSAGNYSDWYEKILSIGSDLPPVADFFVMTTVLRDPQNGNKAKIELIDSSYSSDGDYISQRIWRYKYDSNNNGSFDDESWATLDSGNNINPVLYTTHVGKYLFELSIKESFGEDTIGEFISPSDYRTDDTSDKSINDKICEVINLQPVVDFEVLKKPKIDVVFTVGKTNSSKTQNLNSKINSIIQTKLAAKNIDARIEAIETATTSTQTQDPSAIFSNWVSFYVGNSGTPPSNAWSYDSSLNAVVCNVGSRPAVGWYKPNAFSTKDLTVNYKLGIRNDATEFEHGEMGFMFRMKDVNNYYVYIIDNHSACGNVRYDQRSVLAKVVNGGFQVVKTGGSFPYFYRGQTWNVRIEVKGNNIKIYRDGSLDIEWTDTDSNYYSQGSYGFYVWDQPSAYYKDIQITTESIKTLDEALKTTTWRDNSVRFLVNISDVELPELNDPLKLGDILSRILSANAYFIGLGMDTNKSQYQTFISKNDGKGTFFYNTNMDTALNQAVDYIISIVESMPKLLEQYVLLGEEVSYNTYYNDPENDTKYQERWMYLHDPNYFENSLGLATFSGQYLSSPVTVFDKVGKYEVQYQARDNPKDDNRFDNYRLWSYKPLSSMYIYVHRRPIAQFAVSMTPSGSNYVVSIADQSYDLDHMSLSNKGIHAWEWKWKEVNEASWHDGKMSGIFPVGYTYLVYLRVQDLEGAWSEPKVQTITTQNINLPPVAQFTVNPITQVINKTINITDQSYDPNGDPIAEWQWRVQKTDGTWINYGGTMPNNISSLGIGTYTIELKVRDNPRIGTPLWSEPYTQTVTIIPENNKPVARFTINPNPVVADELYSIDDTSYDPDGDPIVAREWKVQKPDGTWVTISEWKPTFEEMGFGDDGTYKIQLRVLDDSTSRNPNLTPMWSDPYTVTVQVQGKLIVIGSSNKTTYKAGEAMILYAHTEGKAYRVEAKMWYSKNEFTTSNVTTLTSDITLTNPPQDVMTWHTKHTKAEGRDIVVIIPKDMADGTYQIVFTAYKQVLSGGIKTVTDTITVRVKGSIYDHSKSEIIGPKI